MCLDIKSILFVKLSSRSGRLEQKRGKKTVLDHETMIKGGSDLGQVDG